MDILLITTGHHVADARLHRWCVAFERAGLSVRLEASGPAGDAPDSVDFRAFGGGRSLGSRLRRSLSIPMRRYARSVMVPDPELVLAALTWRLLRRRPVIVDVHEDYLALLKDRPWARWGAGALARLVARAATRGARHADLTVVADDHLPPARARRRLVVRNLPDPATLPQGHERDPGPRAIYVGDVRESRGLHTMVAAVEQATPWQLDIVGPIGSRDRRWFEDRLVSGPAAGRVRVHGRLPPDRAWRLAAGAWVGLALLDDTPAFRAAVPTKLYEYLGSGLAVLASPLPRMAEIVTGSGAGALARGPAEAAATLRRWHEQPELLELHREAARRWAAKNLTEPSPFDRVAAEIRAMVGRS